MTTGVAIVVLAVIVLFLLKSQWNYRTLPQLPRLTAGADASVTVIVPARNEEANIARCVASFRSPVIVVDDASTDRTALAATAAGATVVAAPPLPPGTLGKPNACAAGAAHVETDWILFVDADTWFEPDFLASAIKYAEREHLDVLTAFLRQHRVTWPERILLPYAFALYFCGVNAHNVNSADSLEALANGQCLLVRRAAYERLGGHTAVADSVIEDVALARLAKQSGLRLRVVRAENLGSVRMYDSLPAIWRGFEKNSFRFLKVNPITGIQVIAASIALTTWLPAILLAKWPIAAAIAISPVLLLAPAYGSMRDALTAPIGIYGFQLIALSGMLKSLTGGKSVWKGRRV